jgi:hypothetical protein
MHRIVIAVLLASGLVARASAQVLGLPVVNNGVPTGIALAADLGFPNADAGKGTAVGASAAIGIGLIGLGAGVSRFMPDADAASPITSVGGSATLRIFGGPLIPLRVTLQGGVGSWQHDAISIEGESVGTFRTTRVPISLGIAATIPNPALAIKPWVAPRVEIRRVTFDNEGETTSDFAISGGIELTMLSGLGFRAAYDRTFGDGRRPGILSFGIAFAP